MSKPTLSAIIIAKNEEQMLANCLATLSWCDEIVVIDNGSSDKTAQIAENFNAKVISFEHSSFARLREEGAKRASKDYLFYVDADERVTPQLAKEILLQLELDPTKSLKIKRLNVCYGHQLNHGGWQDDWVTRVFPKNSLQGWQGIIHESPVYTAETLSLKQPLVHLTHRSMADNLYKSAQWTIQEASLLYKAGAKPVNFFTLMRKGTMEFWRRLVLKKAYKDGMAGLVEALVQAMNRVFVYIQLWELQTKPSLPDRYLQMEQHISKEWSKNKQLA